MDILNFISWIKGGRLIKTVDPKQSLLPIAVKDAKRDDSWLTNAMTVEDFTAQIKPYKVYTALLTQTGINPPVATVLENTIGDIVWTRASAGRYQGTLVGVFTRDKSICPPYSSNFNDVGNSSIFLPLSSNGNPQLGWVNAYFGGTNNEDYLEIDTYDMLGGVEWSSIIGAGGNLPIEIRVYN